jgi:hypothetical protein
MMYLTCDKKKREVSNLFWGQAPNEYPMYFQSGSYALRTMEISAQNFTSVIRHQEISAFIALNKEKRKNFIDQVKKLEAINYTDAMELLYDKMDEFLSSGNYETCNQLIRQFLTHDFSFKLHLALLTLTNKYKALLPYRAELFANAEKLALLEYRDKKIVNSVLYGLE